MGALDSKFRALATKLIGKFSDSTHELRRVSESYTLTSGSTTPSASTLSVKVSPPFPVEKYQVDGESVLATDVQCIVAAEALEAGSFDPQPAKDVKVTLDYDSRVYRVVRAQPYISGDQKAAWLLTLRG